MTGAVHTPNSPAVSAASQGTPQHRVHRWLQHADGAVQAMPSRRYRAHALAELSHSATFDRRERARERRRARAEAEAMEQADQEQAPGAALSAGMLLTWVPTSPAHMHHAARRHPLPQRLLGPDSARDARRGMRSSR